MVHFFGDVKAVLGYLRSQSKDQCLSDKVLTLKLVILLVLTSASRVSELTSLNINCFVKSETCYIFHLNKLGVSTDPNHQVYSFINFQRLKMYVLVTP